MGIEENYRQWLDDEAIDEKTKDIIIKMSEDEKTDAFYKELEFGTGGIRGILGPGPNRMNVYVVKRVTYALGKVICLGGREEMARGVVIAYDVRHMSRDFALTAARVLCSMGIKVYLYDDIRATPQLSFSIIEIGAQAGIMITASHNPKEYNGYKAYWDDGAQILPELAEKIEKTAGGIKDLGSIAMMDEDTARKDGLLLSPGKDIDDRYIRKVKELSLTDDIDKDISVVYTPLNGTACIPVERVLRERGFTSVHIVKQQSMPDPDFTTAPFPNPEDERAFELAAALGRQTGAKLLIANDPDGDRTAVMAYGDGRYIYLNGNQTGAILVKYITDIHSEKGDMPEKPMIIKTIVTGDLGKTIAGDHGVSVFETLTGFKNISSMVIDKEKEGYRLLLSYEESIGFNAGTFVRDKDGVSTAMLICEAAAYYSKKGYTLYDIIRRIYNEYGYYLENNFSVELPGREGSKDIENIMRTLRTDGIKSLAGRKVTAVTDYLEGIKTDLLSGKQRRVDIPLSDVLRFDAGDDLWICIRPSGTEPKIKLYVYGNSDSYDKARSMVDDVKKEIGSFVSKVT